MVWESAGWAGAVAILGAYLAVSMGWLKAGRSFQLANLFGACAFIANSAFHGAWPSVATNVAWFVISSVALLRMRRPRPLRAADAQVPLLDAPDAPGGAAVMDVLGCSLAADSEAGRHDS